MTHIESIKWGTEQDPAKNAWDRFQIAFRVKGG